MQFLRTNTAVIVTVGPFYDKTDGVTIETALTITNERITLTADTDAGSAPTLILDNITGATSATDNDLNYITAGDSGHMQLELSAANVNRVGRMALSITDAANHVPVFHEFFVLPAVIYDWLTAGVAPLSPTTAGRTLDVSAAGEAGIDWANVGAPTTTLALTGTTIAVTQKVDVETIKTNAVVNAGTITFPTTATLASTTNLTAGTIAAVSGAVGSVTGAVGSVTGAVGSVTGAVGSVTGAVGSVTGAVGSVTGLTAATVHADLDDIQARLPAALTAAGNIKADIEEVNAVTIVGDGGATPWGP